MPIIDARFYKTLLICPNRQYLTELGPLIAHGLPLAPVQDIPAFPSRRQLIDVLKTFEAKLCFIDFSVNSSDPPRVLEDFHTVAPGIPIVALLAGHNPDLILDCVRRGATDFLIHPFTTEQMDTLVETIARILPPPTRPGGGGKTIAVVPAKGGAGATTLSCSLAQQAKRLGAKRIFLGDMDPLAGTVSFLLKLSAGYSFMDVLGRLNALDPDLWKQMVVTSQGLDVLLSPETPPEPAMDLPTAVPILEFAQGAYEALILDCGSAYGSWNLSMAHLCDELLLVSSNELASLQAVQRTVAYLEQNRVETKKIKYVVNRYVKGEGLNSDGMANILSLEPFQLLPNDPDAVQRSIMEGKAIAANTPLGKGLASMADRLMRFKETDTKKDAKKTGLRGMFSR